MRGSREVRAYGPHFKTPLRPGGRSHRRSASCLSTQRVSELTVAGILIKSLRSLSANTNHGSPASKDVWILAPGSTSGKTATPRR